MRAQESLIASFRTQRLCENGQCSHFIRLSIQKKKKYVMTFPAAHIKVQSSAWSFFWSGSCAKEVEACRFGALEAQLRPRRNSISDQNSHPMISWNLPHSGFIFIQIRFSEFHC